MAMTNANMTNPVPVMTAEQVKEAAKLAAQITPQSDEDVLNSASAEFEDQVSLEAAKVAEVLTKEDEKQQAESGKAIRELIEDDAYDLAVPINAGAMYDPNLLKIELKDKNYVARWGNRNNIRQAMLAAQGFKVITLEEVDNPDSLTMFEDSQGHLVYADLVAMKCPKNWYYAGLRKAYLKSKYATNDRKAAEAGAAFASERLKSELKGSERAYMSMHEGKPIYKPNIGV